MPSSRFCPGHLPASHTVTMLIKHHALLGRHALHDSMLDALTAAWLVRAVYVDEFC